MGWFSDLFGGGGGGDGIDSSGIAGSLAGITGSGVSQAANSALGLYSASKSKQWAHNAWKDQTQWLEAMSSTAHQREIADLAAAGINPVLTASGGGGAPSGGAGVASTPDLDLGDTTDLAGRMLSTAQQMNTYKDMAATVKANRKAAEQDAISAEARAAMEPERVSSEVARNWEESKAAMTRSFLQEAQRDAVNADRAGTLLDNAYLEAGLPSARAMGAFDASEWGQFIQRANRVLDPASRATGMVSGGAGRFLRGLLGGRDQSSSEPDDEFGRNVPGRPRRRRR